MEADAKLIGLDMVAAELEHLFREAGGSLDGSLDPSLSSEGLILLAKKHQGFSHWTALLQLIAVHPNADEATIRWILSSTDDSGALNAVATSSRSPRAALEALSNATVTSVREHAALNLLGRDLDDLAPAQFQEILDSHGGDAGIDMGARALLARHPRTPRHVLRALSEDDVDFIQAMASNRLKDH